MGLINELPINQKYASKITQDMINDPFRLVHALKKGELEQNSERDLITFPSPGGLINNNISGGGFS